jgi:hypothetical protein
MGIFQGIAMHGDIGHKIVTLQGLIARAVAYEDPRKDRAKARTTAIREFVDQIAALAKASVDTPQFSDDELRQFRWFTYQCDLAYKGPRRRKGREGRVLAIMRETAELFYDIRDNGLKAPLDMWLGRHNQYILVRGWRRLIIMDVLSKEGLRRFRKIPVRIFKNERSFKRHRPSSAWKRGPVESDSIHALAMKQFAVLGQADTDKYWTHNYTRYYDEHVGWLRDQRIKILEIGVSYGGSLLLWKRAFPKARIYGIEIQKTKWRRMLRRQSRIQVCVGNAADPVFLREKILPLGRFNMIVDDASHVPEDQLVAFTELWPRVARNGYYVIEDLHGNYWGHKAKNGPVFMEHLKLRMDELVGPDNRSGIAAIHAYYNIVFIQKA